MGEKFEVRDFRNKQYFLIDDEYLNGYAKLCGINATGVYISLCRHADKNQKCFPSKKLIAKELAISERSVYSAIKKLEEWKIIKITDQERKENGSFKNLIYTLLDKKEWFPNPSATGAVGKIRQSPSATGAVDRRHVVPNKDTHIKDTHIKDCEILSQWSFEDNLQNWINGKNRAFSLIGRFLKMRGLTFDTKEKMTAAAKRYLRIANQLAPFSDEEIQTAIKKIHLSDFISKDWPMETILKYLTK